MSHQGIVSANCEMEEEVWLEARLAQDDVNKRVAMINRAFQMTRLQAVGFPYLVVAFCWHWRRFGILRHGLLHCAVDRCQGTSITMEQLPLGAPIADAELVQPRLDTGLLHQKAYRHVTQARRHHLKQRQATSLHVSSARLIRKPLWKVDVSHAKYGEMALLLDGLTGGYYVMP
ncbi:hypothetical protein [Vreelandella salicampi]|uniref:Uncharacterized protein n=1 Tax=Vreelandella salicampi TaxID=1449798 RepID=A0A7Z0LLI9_9GAMM|nr:hypothetical protein [Halomonas salicampi]NYS61214.1 hypothetical protein [Halomonas salicampi]